MIANQSFLVPDVSEYVMRILHTITTTAFVIQCVHRVGPVAPVMGTELAMMGSVIVTPIGSTMDVGNVSKLAPVRLFVQVMAHANYTAIHPGVYVKMVGMDPNVISHVPEC